MPTKARKQRKAELDASDQKLISILGPMPEWIRIQWRKRGAWGPLDGPLWARAVTDEAKARLRRSPLRTSAAKAKTDEAQHNAKLLKQRYEKAWEKRGGAGIIARLEKRHDQPISGRSLAERTIRNYIKRYP